MAEISFYRYFGSFSLVVEDFYSFFKYFCAFFSFIYRRFLGNITRFFVKLLYFKEKKILQKKHFYQKAIDNFKKTG